MEHAEFTIQIRREALSTGEDIYVALCLELDIASQSATIEQAKANVIDAIASFFEAASPSEIQQRSPVRAAAYSNASWTTTIEIALGKPDIAKQIVKSINRETLLC